MALKVRAVYEDGNLRLLEPVDLSQGEQVLVTLEAVETTNELEELKVILADLPIRWADPNNDSDAWVEDLADEIDKTFQGDPPLSQMIIEDRGEL